MPAADARAAVAKTQRVLTHTVDARRALEVETILENRPLDDQMAYAFFARHQSRTARAIFTSYPGQNPESDLTSVEFQIIMARLFGWTGSGRRVA